MARRRSEYYLPLFFERCRHRIRFTLPANAASWCWLKGIITAPPNGIGQRDHQVAYEEYRRIRPQNVRLLDPHSTVSSRTEDILCHA